MDVVIRPALADEIALLGDVERDGDRRYAGYDGVPVGFDDTLTPSTLDVGRADGRLWVASAGVGTRRRRASDDGTIIGFALAEPLDGDAHLAQLSVRLAFQGRGVGGRLVDSVRRWAREQAMTAVTLRTFSDVSWNRPLYEHLGFVVVPEGRWTPAMRALVEGDGDLGLDVDRRVVMRLALSTG